ncbi:hypothetical protein, partial [Massilia antarctica]|uniref:hypothetical protein n=1 Tax=Massilia antarctica TaxID=2765360 RepID=UPI0035EF6CFF
KSHLVVRTKGTRAIIREFARGLTWLDAVDQLLDEGVRHRLSCPHDGQAGTMPVGASGDPRPGQHARDIDDQEDLQLFQTGRDRLRRGNRRGRLEG